MHRTARPEGLDLPSSPLQRNHSLSSDRTPPVSGSSLLSPPSVRPDPAYIAASAASQIVNSDRADQGQNTFGGVGENTDVDTAIVSPASLVLINKFLDQLLFSFLASSRSTSIASLRPAILEILKPRLGKGAIDGADEELQGYLAGGDAEELLAFHSSQEFKGEYNLNLVWRRTRLRCMVYTRLGDMEEEDEELYLEQEEGMDTIDGRPRLKRDLGSVSPAAAIFLTSILEFIGEQALLIASEAAQNRAYMRHQFSENPRAVVEEIDMEKIAFNTTLGRLWRSWKKRVRSSSFLGQRPLSRGSERQQGKSPSGGGSTSGKASISEENESGYFDPVRGRSVAGISRTDQRSPPTREKTNGLPEEPDFSAFSTDAPLESNKSGRGRPRSMIEYNKAPRGSPVHTTSPPHNSNIPRSTGSETRPPQRRQRSSSVPARQSPYVSPIDETFITPSEGPDSFLRNEDRSNAEKEMPKLTDNSTTVHGITNGNPALSTIYDGIIVQRSVTPPVIMDEQNKRGSSTSTESSNNTGEYNHEMTPQAKNLQKGKYDVSAAPRESRASTLSSNYSFLVGDIDSERNPAGLTQEFAGKENLAENRRLKGSGSLDQPSTGHDRQHVGTFADLAILQGHQLRTYDDSGKAVKRDIPILYQTSSDEDVLHHLDDPKGAYAGSHADTGVLTPTKQSNQAGSINQGVPALSPLREYMETTHETSDEVSSSVLSSDTSRPDNFVPGHRYRESGNASISSSILSQARSPASTSKKADPRSHPIAVNTGAEKAAVQRISSSSATLHSATGRNSTSSNRPMTANSNTSQMSSKIKGIIGRESGDLIRQPMPRRNSSDGSGSFVKTPTKEQDFEDLIKSDETVKYTLTPQNMREMETPDSPRYQDNSRFETAELADFLRTSAPANVEADRPATSRSSKLKGLNGLRSNPASITSSATPTRGLASTNEMVKAQSSVKSRSPAPSSPGVIARDPTTQDDSLRDFADFIRSTGPDTPAKALPNPIASNPVKVSRPGSSSSPVVGAAKAPPRKISKQNPVAPPRKPDMQPSKPTILKLQAREPTVGNNNATADLAEFLRTEPVGGQANGSSSSPRSIPSAQRTASSGLTNGNIREVVNSGSSVTSTQDSVTPSKVTQSSTNSRTGLLDSSNRALPTSAPAIRDQNQNRRPPRNDDPPGPSRKQRRVRDPYALDSDSDNDNDDGNGALQPPHEREESLNDFLRNYTPSPEATIARSDPPTISGAPKPAKQSGPTMRERLARNIAVIPDYRPLPPKAPKKASSKSPPQSNASSQSTRSVLSAQRQHSGPGFSPPTQNNIVRGRSTNAAPQLPPLNSHATSPQLVSQNATKTDTRRAPQQTYAHHVDRGPRKHLQAREEPGVLGRSSSGGGMSDLAEFLRDTEPPAPSGPIGGARPTTLAKEKEESAFGRMFGRRKKEVK